MRTVIYNQKKERDYLLTQPYLSRCTEYSTDTLLLNHNIKLITGPRRAGKSTQALLMLKDQNFAYLNFDDNKLLELWDEDLAMSILYDVYPGYDFLLLDELQNVKGWDIWVSKLYRRGINMIITGSNANMLSSEMATLLTGRYIEVKMLPFSLQETMEWNHIDLQHVGEEQKMQALSLQHEYLLQGGYPETVAARSITQGYLSTLFDSIIYKDIVRRHNVRNVIDLNNVAAFLLSNFCNVLSYNNVCDNLGLSSVSTTKKFMNYLSEPYLFFYLPRYDNKLKLMKKAPQKVYVVDNGLISSRAFNLSENLGRLLENQVFIELLRKGYSTLNSLFYYRSRNDKETDFVLRNGTRVEQLIQVSYDISNEKTLKREVSSLIECAGELHCSNLTIVTFSEERIIERGGYIINVIPIAKL